MNRRSFFKSLGIGVAGVALTPLLPLEKDVVYLYGKTFTFDKAPHKLRKVDVVWDGDGTRMVQEYLDRKFLKRMD